MLRVPLIVRDILWFQMNFNIVFSVCLCEERYGDFKWDYIEYLSSFCNMTILPMFILPFHEHGKDKCLECNYGFWWIRRLFSSFSSPPLPIFCLYFSFVYLCVCVWGGLHSCTCHVVHVQVRGKHLETCLLFPQYEPGKQLSSAGSVASAFCMLSHLTWICFYSRKTSWNCMYI